MLRKDGMACSHALSLLQKAKGPNKTFTSGHGSISRHSLLSPLKSRKDAFHGSLSTALKIMRTIKLVFRVLQSFPDVFVKKAFPP